MGAARRPIAPAQWGGVQIDAGAAPRVPILGCEWAPAQPTPPPTENRGDDVRDAADDAFPPLRRRRESEIQAPPSLSRLGEESIAYGRSTP